MPNIVPSRVINLTLDSTCKPPGALMYVFLFNQWFFEDHSIFFFNTAQSYLYTI